MSTVILPYHTMMLSVVLHSTNVMIVIYSLTIIVQVTE